MTVSRRLAVLSFLLLLPCGCGTLVHSATNQLFANKPLAQEDIESPDTLILNLPFYRQTEERECGKYALASVMAFERKSFDAERFLAVTTTSDEKGYSGKELVELGGREGFTGSIVAGDLARIFRSVGEKLPPIVILSNWGRSHFVAVIGYHRDGRMIVLDPEVGWRYLDISDFLSRWKEGNYFTLVLRQGPGS